MQKLKILSKITDCGLVAVVRAENSEQAVKIADACAKAGIAGIEITFTVPGAAKVIEDLAKVYQSGEIIIGAGTVMDPETARIAILAGAQYIVSPSLNFDTIKLCNRYQIPVMPGCATIREIVEAMEAGADIIKVFPGEALGATFVKAVKGPLPQAPLMPTGGVGLDNVADWIKAGCVAVGAGGNLTAGAKKGDYQSITDIGKQFIEKIRAARAGAR
ncbi:bifunctional 2-keto-4-hydroxyglutarate aldolase/2-keto-3-deoxy-6-phosphogluconate aldolase [Acetonema longum]|uniref:2-dehydro-3-deoxyphosphogluconate aldolase/4-hydroxy-2-oxoglutarate aldolase n=1 Tax=Acetonema longum DSM 6540 TaxID=1009370 RepID=F7NG20_9FIRM|nr:bifunctional 2-keto-4-hydroxyglutarate aldolase/2-keto-3-deoxy-6-phosphogluconate aldolase [Acetonema longum]EGO64938.1 2-dehydro-3-deoxyphosphogluconate aldolase/4-hydroxy-2-oxoglutarate aldolase [Acetonema longum DSM 6540]